MLEAGPMLDVAKHYTEHTWVYNLQHRGMGVGGSGYNAEGNRELDVAHIGRIPGEPYSNAPGSAFSWTRGRLLGGRTNHWNRVALRFAPADFNVRSRTGVGSDWPITYDDLAPYYDKVEAFIGVYGTREGIPSAPDGIFQPPPKPRCTDLMVQRGARNLGIPCIPGRAAILTRALNGRPPCHYCGQCVRGCGMASTFSSGQAMIPQAQATGRLTVIPNAMAREVTVNKAGRVDGVVYIDKASRGERQVSCRAMILGASSCESARLLLNSKSALFPDGLANSHGVVGRYLMDTVGSGVTGHFPALSKMPPHNDEGTASVHLYIPWWKYDRKNDYTGGYHVEIYGGRSMPSPNEFHAVAAQFQGYGAGLKQACRETYGTTATLAGRGEMIPDERSYCEIDKDQKDDFGIPVLRFHFRWGDNELRMARDMNQNLRAIIEAAGGKVLSETGSEKSPYGYLSPGGVAHELGVVRMGKDPGSSVLNSFCQAHDVKNLFVTDGGCFTTNPDKNPTVTILAISWRAAEYLADEAKKGNL
jgi:choline dehydrogenase-like flavoprotein